MRLWRRIALGEAAAILALAALLVAPEAPSSRAAGEFRLLGAASGSIPNGEARRLRVVFDDRVDQRSLRELLLPLGAEIVGGPSPLGVYTVAVPEDRRSEPLTWLVSHLRSLPEVRFVEPVNEVATP